MLQAYVLGGWMSMAPCQYS